MKDAGMEPGRELDRLVAEKVMGLKILRAGDLDLGWDQVGCVYPPEHFMRHIKPDDKLVELGAKPGHYRYIGIPPYSTDLTAAFEVLEHLSTLHLGKEYHPDYRTNKPANCRMGLYKPLIRLDLYEHDDEYNVTIGRCKGVGMDDDIVQTVIGRDFMSGTAWAICLAALKAVQKYEKI